MSQAMRDFFTPSAEHAGCDVTARNRRWRGGGAGGDYDSEVLAAEKI
jgi:hypothetical protein